MILEQGKQGEFVERWLTGSQRKTAFALRQNCENMIAGHSRRKLVELELGNGKTQKAFVTDAPENLACTGFLTLTVGDWKDGKFRQVFDAAEASRRINNLNRRILPELFERAIVVTERHKSGAIHFHVLGILRGRPDIRTGFDFGALAAMRKRGGRFAASDVGASPELAALWKRLRATLPEYGFGRNELTPIRKTSEAVACYISKYIEKNVCNRLPADRRKKLVRYIGFNHEATPAERGEVFRATGRTPKRISEQTKPNDFSWGTARAIAWRGKARELASLVQIYDKAEFGQAMGARWAFTVTRFMHQCGDTTTPFLVLSWRERETMRAEMAREIGIHEATRIDARKLRFSAEMADIRATWPFITQTTEAFSRN